MILIGIHKAEIWLSNKKCPQLQTLVTINCSIMKSISPLCATPRWTGEGGFESHGEALRYTKPKANPLNRERIGAHGLDYGV